MSEPIPGQVPEQEIGETELSPEDQEISERSAGVFSRLQSLQNSVPEGFVLKGLSVYLTGWGGGDSERKGYDEINISLGKDRAELRAPFSGGSVGTDLASFTFGARMNRVRYDEDTQSLTESKEDPRFVDERERKTITPKQEAIRFLKDIQDTLKGGASAYYRKYTEPESGE